MRAWHATPGLDPHRFWDERYLLENVERLLKHGQIRPANGLHPGLSYLPHSLLLKTSDWMHQATGVDALAVFTAKGDFTPTAYLLCRLLQVVFAVTSLFLVFLIGRKLGSDRLALLATLFLSVIPWHIRQSVVFKADMTLIVTLLFAFYLSIRAIESPTLGRYGAAGAAIGLALASKFNAAPIAIPLVVGSFLAQGIAVQPLRYLLAAGGISVAVFVALNPYSLIEPDIYRRSIGRTLRVYERRAQSAGVESTIDLLPHVLRTVVSGGFFGRALGSLSLLGAALVTLFGLKDFRRSRRAIYWLMLASYLVGYTTFYALITHKPDPHNWLPLAPFFALCAAWIVDLILTAASNRLTRRGVRWLVPTSIAVLTAVLVWPAASFTYHQTVPTTADRALEFLYEQLIGPQGRLILTETNLKISPHMQSKKRRLAIGTMPRLSAISGSILNFSDAEIFLVSSMEDENQADFYRQRLAGSRGSEVMTIEPSPFKAQGPSLICVLHPLKRGAKPVQGAWVQSSEDRQLYRARFPEPIAPRTIVSLEFELPYGHRVADLGIGDRDLFTTTYRPRGKTVIHSTSRFRFTDEIEMWITGPRYPQTIPLVAKRWRTTRR